jgi:hypothetical protein
MGMKELQEKIEQLLRSGDRHLAVDLLSRLGFADAEGQVAVVAGQIFERRLQEREITGIDPDQPWRRKKPTMDTLQERVRSALEKK